MDRKTGYITVSVGTLKMHLSAKIESAQADYDAAKAETDRESQKILDIRHAEEDKMVQVFDLLHQDYLDRQGNAFRRVPEPHMVGANRYVVFNKRQYLGCRDRLEEILAGVGHDFTDYKFQDIMMVELTRVDRWPSPPIDESESYRSVYDQLLYDGDVEITLAEADDLGIKIDQFPVTYR